MTKIQNMPFPRDHTGKHGQAREHREDCQYHAYLAQKPVSACQGVCVPDPSWDSMIRQETRNVMVGAKAVLPPASAAFDMFAGVIIGQAMLSVRAIYPSNRPIFASSLPDPASTLRDCKSPGQRTDRRDQAGIQSRPSESPLSH